MRLTHLVAATDESLAGRQAVWTTLELAAECSARVTVMRTVSFDSPGQPGLEHLPRWGESDLPAVDSRRPVGAAGVRGLPGIEIGRFAERVHADLLVLGRKPHSRTARLLLGD